MLFIPHKQFYRAFNKNGYKTDNMFIQLFDITIRYESKGLFIKKIL